MADGLQSTVAQASLWGLSPLNSIGTGKGLCPSLSQKSKAKEEVKEEGEGTSSNATGKGKGLCSSLSQKSSESFFPFMAPR